MSTTQNLLKKVVLTQAQFTARQTAGTLQEGVEYEISDARDDVVDVQVNGTSVVNATTGVANITDATLADVKYTAQSLTDAQKTQARSNISAITMEEYNSSASSYSENVLYYVVD